MFSSPPGPQERRFCRSCQKEAFARNATSSKSCSISCGTVETCSPMICCLAARFSCLLQGARPSFSRFSCSWGVILVSTCVDSFISNKGWSHTTAPPYPLLGKLCRGKLPSLSQTQLEETSWFKSHKNSAQADMYSHRNIFPLLISLAS